MTHSVCSCLWVSSYPAAVGTLQLSLSPTKLMQSSLIIDIPYVSLYIPLTNCSTEVGPKQHMQDRMLYSHGQQSSCRGSTMVVWHRLCHLSC